jgi:hypothetical protein
MTEQEMYQKDMDKVKQAILEGKIYANVNSVSRSGMSRRISFYMVEDGAISRVTREVAWLTGWVPVGENKSRGKYMVDAGLYVGGCGMDMIFHTLYTALHEQAKDWNQHYNTL